MKSLTFLLFCITFLILGCNPTTSSSHESEAENYRVEPVERFTICPTTAMAALLYTDATIEMPLNWYISINDSTDCIEGLDQGGTLSRNDQLFKNAPSNLYFAFPVADGKGGIGGWVYGPSSFINDVVDSKEPILVWLAYGYRLNASTIYIVHTYGPAKDAVKEKVPLPDGVVIDTL